MSRIKLKVGQCIDCDDNEPKREIMAKRCVGPPYYHHGRYKAAVYAENSRKRKVNKSAAIALDNDGMTLAQWYADKINMLPKHCENCGEYLNPYHPWGAHVYIAHIVPKRSFVSVCVDPYNLVYLCGDCHTNYDTKDSEYIITMNCWPVLIERFILFSHKIKQEELSGLQDCYRQYVR